MGNFSVIRLIDWIWNVRGALPLGFLRSGGDAIDKLDVLLRTEGTSLSHGNGTLRFHKKMAAHPQDKMAAFNRGILEIVEQPSGPELHYDLFSKGLLFCFLAPLLFLSIAGLFEASRTPGLVFASLFVLVYIMWRSTVQRSVQTLFRTQLLEPADG